MDTIFVKRELQKLESSSTQCTAQRRRFAQSSQILNMSTKSPPRFHDDDDGGYEYQYASVAGWLWVGMVQR